MSTTMNKPAIFDIEKPYYKIEETKESFVDKLKRNPAFLFAFTGFTSIVTYKLYRIRQDRKAGIQQRLSLQLINTRLVAQGFVIGSLTLSVAFMLAKRIYGNFFPEAIENTKEDKKN